MRARCAPFGSTPCKRSKTEGVLVKSLEPERKLSLKILAAKPRALSVVGAPEFEILSAPKLFSTILWC
eukprot:5351996-Pyramimonas_sp.AAC.1